MLAIVGKVGCGKSSLLSCFLKEIPTYSGHIYYNKSVAYVEQEPYIFNGTVKDNIILGQLFNKTR